jgi:hypothetical protein
MSGPGPGSGGPFYFHYVTDSTVAFSEACYTFDEAIFSFKMDHDEGQIPTLEIEIANPGVGLLSSGRSQWAWFSYWNGSAVVPLFFGRLDGIPSDLFRQVIKIKFRARAPDYISRKQALAETLKVAPYYDPVLLDDAHRSDLEAILEGWSATPHVDRTSMAWSISDILAGEDGTVVFDGDHAFYDSLEFHIDQPPFTSIRVDLTANWSQSSTGGSLKLGPYNFKTYTGQSLMNDWPKPGAAVGGGWVAQASSVLDVSGISTAQTISTSYSWQNADKQHAEGDTMSVNISMSQPYFATATNYIEILLTTDGHSGGIIDGEGVPSSAIRATYLWVPEWTIQTTLYLESKADRKRTEYLTFLLQSDLQPVLTDPDVQQDSEVIKINTVDLSAPLIDARAWTILAGTSVALGQICLPNNPTTPGGTSYQVCTTPGVCGTTEPTFSDVPGFTTSDGTAVWACVGESLPTIGDWKPATAAALGTIIAPTTPAWIYYSALLPPVVPYRTSGAQVSEGTIIRADNHLSYQVCTIAGTTQYLTVPAFSSTWGATTTDGSVQWTSLGYALPAGSFQIAVQAGQSAVQVPPPWSANPGDQVTDGTIHWKSLGMGGPSISIPAGGMVGNVLRRSYFPTERGIQTLEAALMKGRAHLRKRARCVEIGFEAPFSMGVSLSCRKNATIIDPRLPGKTETEPAKATGKITSYSLTGNGDTGTFLTKVKIGCAVGGGNSVSAVAGTGVYAVDGVFAPGVQQMTGATVLPASGDVGYGPPLDDPNDDGLVFPLTPEQVVVNQTIVGSLATQEAAIKAAIPVIQQQAQLQQEAATFAGADAMAQLDYQARIAKLGNVTVDSILAKPENSLYLDLQLAPLTGSAFTTVYNISTTKLQIPQQINLGA